VIFFRHCFAKFIELIVSNEENLKLFYKQKNKTTKHFKFLILLEVFIFFSLTILFPFESALKINPLWSFFANCLKIIKATLMHLRGRKIKRSEELELSKNKLDVKMLKFN